MSALLPSLNRQSVIASAGATLFEQHPREALIRWLYDAATGAEPNFDQEH